MVEVSRTVVVDAPVEAVFAFVDEPENQVAITPGLTSVSDVEPLENGGKRLSYTYSMAGVAIRGRMETPVYEPPGRVVFELTDGPLAGEIEWLLASVDADREAGGGADDAGSDPAGTDESDGESEGAGGDGRTRFTYRADYRLPSRVLDRVAEPLVRRYNERQLDRTVETLRERFADGASTPDE
jgi:carbon monoxide dehydrogenase subunit G